MNRQYVDYVFWIILITFKYVEMWIWKHVLKFALMKFFLCVLNDKHELIFVLIEFYCILDLRYVLKSFIACCGWDLNYANCDWENDMFYMICIENLNRWSVHVLWKSCVKLHDHEMYKYIDLSMKQWQVNKTEGSSPTATIDKQDRRVWVPWQW